MLTIDTHKVCSRCGDIKLHNEFYRDRKSKDGLTFCCKKCKGKKSKDITKVRTHKACSWCKEIKPLSEFPIWKRNKKTGRRHNCKKCHNAYTRSIRRYHQHFVNIPENKTCQTCKITKPANQFSIRNCTSDRLDFICKICRNIVIKHYRQNRPQKTCNLCETTKPRIKFPKNVHSKDGRWHICKECFNDYEVDEGDVDTLVDKIQEKRKNEIHKTCTKCGVNKPLSDFYRKRQNKDGRNSACKKCENKRTLKAYHDGYRRPSHITSPKTA